MTTHKPAVTVMPDSGVTVRQALAAFTLMSAAMQGAWERATTGATTPDTNRRWTDARDAFETVRATPERPAGPRARVEVAERDPVA